MIQVEKLLPTDISSIGIEIPKAHLESFFVAKKEDEIVGHIGFYQNKSLGCDQFLAGSYHAINDTSVSFKLLNAIAEEAKSKGAKKLIGPMNGSSWENYRFTEKSGELPFFMEPVQPDFYHHQWRQFGFRQMESYFSSVTEVFNFSEKIEISLDQKFKSMNVSIETFDFSKKEETLKQLADFNNEAFAKNDFFSPINKNIFVEKYKRIIAQLDSELIFLAKMKNQIVGLLFCYPDFNDPTRKTLVAKTLARIPQKELHTLCLWIYLKMLPKAEAKGFTKIIHALMKNDNYSLQRSRQVGGKIFRKYWLYELAF